MFQPEYDCNGSVCRLAWWLENVPEPVYSLNCEQCGGDLLVGRNTTVCERGCAVFHKTPVNWLEKHYPQRRIVHGSFRKLLKDVAEGAQRLMKLDNEP